MAKSGQNLFKFARLHGMAMGIIILNLSSLNAFCQKELNNWYFGYRAGISFNGGRPYALANGKMSTNEGCATISDKNGRLLFYTDGVSVWDSTHNTTPNGNSLMGNFSTTQSAIIVPRPNISNQYYIFTVDAQAEPKGLSYSLFNIDLNSGKGDIEPTCKNIKLSSPVCEKVTAVQHSNGRDYWVITHKFYSDTLYAYLITKYGIKGKPIKSATNFSLKGRKDNTIGYMKISHDGTRIVYANYDSDWCGFGAFNSKTGEVKNVWQFNIDKPYGVEFSPSGEHLYISSTSGKIYQYNTKAKAYTDFINSQMEIFIPGYTIGALQLGPDKKIYICHVGYNYLDVIHAPDSNGTNCRVQKNYVGLNTYTGYGLPNFTQYDLRPGPKFTAGCHGDTAWFTFVEGELFDSIKWVFGDAKSSKNKAKGDKVFHIYSDTGKFKVQCISFKSNQQDSFYLYLEQKAFLNFSLGKDAIVCHMPYLILGNSELKYAEYTWSDKSRDTFLLVNKNGTYSLNVKDKNGCKGADTIKVQFLPFPKVNLGKDTQLCGSNFLTLDAKNYTPYTKYIWNTSDTGQKLLVQKTGLYMVTITNPCGIATDSIQLIFSPIPKISLPKDTLICDVPAVTLNASIMDPDALYYWSTGVRNSLITVTSTGQYKIKVVNACGFDEDSSNITFNTKPKVDLGPNKVFCDTMFPVIRSLRVGDDETIRWSTGSKDTFNTFTAPGIYWACISNPCGEGNDTLNISISAIPVVKLGMDTAFCKNFAFLLDAGNPGASYLWQPTGEISRTIFARKHLTYDVTVKDSNGCTGIDKLTIADHCKSQYWFPNIFSPNGDYLNETFSPVMVNCKDYSLKIFNRWGEILFETNDPKNQWDGNYRGSICQQGVYYYLCRFVILESGNDKVVKGVVHLERW